MESSQLTEQNLCFRQQLAVCSGARSTRPRPLTLAQLSGTDANETTQKLQLKDVCLQCTSVTYCDSKKCNNIYCLQQTFNRLHNRLKWKLFKSSTIEHRLGKWQAFSNASSGLFIDSNGKISWWLSAEQKKKHGNSDQKNSKMPAKQKSHHQTEVLVVGVSKLF